MKDRFTMLGGDKMNNDKLDKLVEELEGSGSDLYDFVANALQNEEELNKLKKINKVYKKALEDIAEDEYTDHWYTSTNALNKAEEIQKQRS